MDDRCRLCRWRHVEGSEYCVYHHGAFKNLKGAYEIWKKAMNVDWNTFLKEVSENSETGIWAREVAVSLLNNKKF